MHKIQSLEIFKKSKAVGLNFVNVDDFKMVLIIFALCWNEQYCLRNTCSENGKLYRQLSSNSGCQTGCMAMSQLASYCMPNGSHLSQQQHLNLELQHPMLNFLQLAANGININNHNPLGNLGLQLPTVLSSQSLHDLQWQLRLTNKSVPNSFSFQRIQILHNRST